MQVMHSTPRACGFSWEGFLLDLHLFGRRRRSFCLNVEWGTSGPSLVASDSARRLSLSSAIKADAIEDPGVAGDFFEYGPFWAILSWRLFRLGIYR